MASVIEQPLSADQPVTTAQDGENQENKDPAQDEEGSLRKMFVEGAKSIATHRSENLFQQLESTTLTEEQQKIIDQRVALQRKMFEQYEKRERQRKVAELQDVVPELTAEEAERALDLCDGREEDAAAQLVSDAAFLRQVKAACASGAAEPPAAAGAAASRREGPARASRQSRPAGPRPKLVDPAKLGDSVFMGAFRGKGYTGGSKPATKPAAHSRKAAAPTSSADPSDHEADHEAAGASAIELAAAAAACLAPKQEQQLLEDQQDGEGAKPPTAGASKKPRSRQGAGAGAGTQRAKRSRRAPSSSSGGEETVPLQAAAAAVAAEAARAAEEGGGLTTAGDIEQTLIDGQLAATAVDDSQQEQQEPGTGALPVPAANEEEAAEQPADAGVTARAATPAGRQGQEPGQTPITIPKKYALAVETSDGGYRPATESEVRALEDLQSAAAPAGGANGAAGQQATPSSGPKPDGNDTSAAADPAAPAAGTAPAAQHGAVVKTAALLARMPIEKGGQWLLRMAKDARHATLELLEASQAEKAAALRALLAFGTAPPTAPASGEPAAADAGFVQAAGLLQHAAAAGPEAGCVAAAAAEEMQVEVPALAGHTTREACAVEAAADAAVETQAKGPARRVARSRAQQRQPASPGALCKSEEAAEGEEELTSCGEDDVDEEDFSLESSEADGGSSSSSDEEEELEAPPGKKPQRRAAVAPAAARAASGRAPRAAKAAATALLRSAAAMAGLEAEADEELWDSDSEGGQESSKADSDSDFEEGEEAARSPTARKAKRGGSRGAKLQASRPPSVAHAPAAAAKPASPLAAVASEGTARDAAHTAAEPAEAVAGTKAPARTGRKAAASRKKQAAAPASPGASAEVAAGVAQPVEGPEHGSAEQQAEQEQREAPAGKPGRGSAGGSHKAPPAKKQRTVGGKAAAAAASVDMAAEVAAAPMEVEGTAGLPDGDEAEPQAQRGRAAAGGSRTRAISSTGHTCRGRVKQKSHKSADLVEAGELRAEKGWHNAGYIFPAGFVSRTLFRSSVALDQLCVHECFILGRGGQYWPQPTFKVVALDRPDEPLIAKSCTGCWTGILKRINAEIEARRRQGEDLPPPPKTAIAGPEYFGLNQPNIQEAIEALDPEHRCTEYWAGKEQRQRAAAGLPAAPAAPRPPRAPRSSAPSATKRAGGRGRKRRAGSDSEDDRSGGGEEEDETAYMTNRWSAVSRTERYKKRLEAEGEDTSAIDEDNPLPDFIDPITLEPVVRPAISPYGHVMGMATWRAVLAESSQCPFTKQPLKAEQCKLLSKSNIHLYQDKIIR